MAIAAPALETVAPAAPRAIAAPAMRKAKGGRPPKAATPESHAPAASYAPTEGTGVADVIALLTKKPMSSGELIAALPKRPPSAIYSALDWLRKKGRINMLPNPNGVGKLNELTS